MSGPARTWTLQEAQQALPDVREALAEARAALAALRDAKAHMDDLVVVYGTSVESEGDPGHPEWRIHSGRFHEARTTKHRVEQQLAARGIELKDIDTGLVDFYALRGEELVFLCWRAGEPDIRAWHGLREGFAGRRSIGDIVDWQKA